ncbi:hypothetical protein HMPREF3230_00687 [Gardnerella vaginalis]|uniref:Uncharacterized protein n=1 Tax=Gardnerella vaginalis TaxID=2702 RepID=A0A135Z6S7_GARVA|nr:hypothetical protein HMPREF3230_00687 [Gardnerella vaginalis]
MLGSQDQTVICVLKSADPQAPEKITKIAHKSNIKKRYKELRNT